MSNEPQPNHNDRAEERWGPTAHIKGRALLAPYYGPPANLPRLPAGDQLPPDPERSMTAGFDRPPPPRIEVGIVDASPYYAEAVAYAIEPDERFRPISCFMTPDYIPFVFDGVIVLTARDQRTLDEGLTTKAARFPRCPVVVVTPTTGGLEYLSLIAYPGIAFCLNGITIDALKRAIANASAVAASFRLTPTTRQSRPWRGRQRP